MTKLQNTNGTYSQYRQSGFFISCAGINYNKWYTPTFEDMSNATWKGKHERLLYGTSSYTFLVQRWMNCTTGYLYNYNVGAWEAKTPMECGIPDSNNELGWSVYENYRTMYPSRPDCPFLDKTIMNDLTVGGTGHWRKVSPSDINFEYLYSDNKCFVAPVYYETPVPNYHYFPFTRPGTGRPTATWLLDQEPTPIP
ncbi:MAG: hypothetical protein HC853_06220 [Anaerolineae bacterium]|nr:hypothetical protein [Anaerolineae bacterium]